MKLFLTGESRVGKSTALQRALEMVGLEAFGVETYFREGTRDLHIRAYGSKAPGFFLARMPEGTGGDLRYGFDVMGAGLLREARRRGEIIVVDEIGFLEEHCQGYRKELLNCLEGPKPLLAVLGRRGRLWMEEVLDRRDVQILELVPGNREEAPIRIAQMLLKNTRQAELSQEIFKNMLNVK